MFSKTILATAALVAGAMGQSSVDFTDSASGIKFSYYETDGVAFGLALPEATTSNDFIGYLASDFIDGYAAWSMTGAMANNLLICAWVDGDSIVASLREATGYTNPAEISNSSMGIYEISTGTSINSTGWSFTFLCKGCAGLDISFDASDAESVFGYAQSTTALDDTSVSDAVLNFHDGTYGAYAHSISDAKSSDYATWAALASTTNLGATVSASTGSNSTTSSNSTTTTTTTTTTTSNSTYDYIVAGGGAAGIIVAERLVESGASVLLLERGPASYYASGGDDTMTYNDTVTQYDVPAMAYYLTTASDTTEYCSDTAGMAGCLLGGSTSINAMMFVKPAAHDFDDKWPTGWKWDDVSASAEAFYERTPGFILANGTGVDQGAFGVVSSFLENQGNFSHVDALASPNSKDAVFSHPPWLVRDGLRGGPVKDYLPLAQAKSNFKMSLNTQLVRVIRSNSTATGVEVELEDGSRQIINLKSGGSVVMAGGALSTPRMLVNSGIGVKAQIQAVQSGSVSVTLPDESEWIELPVGQYIQDHPIFTVSLATKDSFYVEPASAFTSPNTTTVTAFNDQSQGLLAQPGQRLSFWTKVAGNDSVTHYIQGTVAPSANDTIRIKTYLTHGLTSHGVLEVTGQGTTELTTSCYLQTASDISAITTWMNQLIAMTQADGSPFEPLNKTAAELIETTNISEGDHYVGSARMGTANDGTSVVDASTLKVWGTDNIYVVDASIHPDLPTGNTQAIIMVVAEKAASVILNGASSSSSSSTTGTSSTSASTTAASSSSAAATTTAAATPKKQCKKRRAASNLTL